jgi:hypothetical protein
MIAEVMAFYGLGWGDAIRLEFRWFTKLYKHIPAIEAKRLLAWLPAFAFPHVDAAAREAIQARLVQQSGVARQRQEQMAAENYEIGWAQLRGFGVAAQTGVVVPAPEGT